MRVAALYDVHANLPALEAVLTDAERAGAELVLFGGDLVSGPFPQAALERARGVAGARFLLGNADLLDPDLPLDAWLLERLSDDDLAFVRGFEERIVVDGVLYRHGSPRSIDEIVTPLTPEAAVAEMLAEVPERVAVVGHTHVQFDRTVGGRRLVNAGSVGIPYEGRRGAYWAILDGGEVELRRSDYDVEAAAAAIPAGYPDRDQLIGWLLEPPSAGEVAAFFEQQAGRTPPA
jgi:predicted phosphodiesterase